MKHWSTNTLLKNT